MFTGVLCVQDPRSAMCAGSHVCHGVQAVGVQVFSQVESWMTIKLSENTVSAGKIPYLKAHRLTDNNQVHRTNLAAQALRGIFPTHSSFWEEAWVAALCPTLTDVLPVFQLTATLSSNINFSFSQLQL